MAKLDPGVVLAERFRVEHELPFSNAQPAFVTLDQETGDRLVAFDVALETSAALRPGVGVTHPHLATIRGIVAHEDTDVLLFEHVTGHDGEAFADGTARLTRVDTVRFILRALDALQALHQAGASHGLVRPTALVVDPDERARPVLRFAPPVAGPSPYRSPERGESGAPSQADDTWAATAVLFRLLTGTDPPSSGFASQAEVTAAGIDNESLAEAIAQGLASDPASRGADLQRLRRDLAHWFAEHAGDDAGGSSKELRPPPLPARTSQPPSVQGPGLATTLPSHTPGFTTSVPSAPKPKRRGPMVAVFAVLAVVVGLGAAYLVSAFRAKPRVKLVQTPASAAGNAGTAPSAVSLGEVAVTGKSETEGGGDRLTSCVAAHLPKGSFKKQPDLTWLCTETDPRSGGDKLKVAVVTGAAGQTTDAMRLFSQLGWYEMAAFAAVREACCGDLKPLELPPPAKGCDPLTQPLASLAKALGAAQSYDEPISRFEKTAKCETDAKHASVYHRTAAPLATEQAAFRELMKSVQ